jgi:hypothetical protein
MMFVAGALLLAGVARAAGSSSAVPANEEKTLETGTPYSQPYLDYASCSVNSKAVTEAMLAVPDEERGKVAGASGCLTATDKVWPTTVDDRDHR